LTSSSVILGLQREWRPALCSRSAGGRRIPELAVLFRRGPKRQQRPPHDWVAPDREQAEDLAHEMAAFIPSKSYLPYLAINIDGFGHQCSGRTGCDFLRPRPGSARSAQRPPSPTRDHLVSHPSAHVFKELGNT